LVAMMSSPKSVFITVDTETSIGGAFADPRKRPVGAQRRIFCRRGGAAFGIPLIMDIADAHGLTVVFFLEVFNRYFFGEGPTHRVCDYILKRGHDVQLHIHPNYLNFTTGRPARPVFSDLMGHYSLDRQIDMLLEAREWLTKWGVTDLHGFRAGCFGAGLTTLTALGRAGFFVDSSYNAAYLGFPCLIPDLKINDLAPINGVWELPVTNFEENLRLIRVRRKPLDINGVSFEEIRSVLRSDRHLGPHHITVVLHSFSFVKAYDVQYRRIRPRVNVIARFERLCRYLADNPERYRVRDIKSLSPEALAAAQHQACHRLPCMAPVLSGLRAVVQVGDRLV